MSEHFFGRTVAGSLTDQSHFTCLVPNPVNPVDVCTHMAAYSCHCSSPAGSRHLLHAYLSKYSFILAPLCFPFLTKAFNSQSSLLVWKSKWENESMLELTQKKILLCFKLNVFPLQLSVWPLRPAVAGRMGMLRAAAVPRGWERAGSFLPLAVLAQSV